MPTTPMEALQRLIEIIKTGIASGHLLGTLRENWQEIVDAVCDLIQWALTLDDDKIEPVGASGDDEGMTALGHQLAVLYSEETGVVMGLGGVSWLTLVIWILQLLERAKAGER